MNNWLMVPAVCGVAVVLVAILVRWAPRIGLIDAPNERKHHEGQVPLIGGIAMFWAFLFGLVFLGFPLIEYHTLVAGGLLLLVVGMLDDLRELPKRVRFPAQIVAGLMMAAWGGVLLKDLGQLGFSGVFDLGAFALPFTVFCTVGVINAVNMADGMDGLAGGLSLVTFGALAYFAYSAGLSADLGVLMVLMASVLGFLVFNMRTPLCSKAKVFMGDAGSMFLGFALAWFLIRFSQGESRAMNPVTALWIFALPLMDTVAIMLRRIAKGQSPFVADRQHFHHVLLSAGFSVGQTVVMICGLALVLALIGIAGQEAGVSENTMFLTFLGLFSVYVAGMRHAWKVMRVLARAWNPRRHRLGMADQELHHTVNLERSEGAREGVRTPVDG